MLPKLSALPYDILRMLTRLVDGADVVSLLSTCKGLHTLVQDDTIWQEHCARYGVTDRAVFDATFYEIYSQVLHTYGPLLGLWASDHPYRGSIIEFRLEPIAHRIVGELWKFPLVNTPIGAQSWHLPSSPEYVAFVAITLPHTPLPRRGRLDWNINGMNTTQHFVSGEDSDQMPMFHVLSPTNESLYLCYGTEGTCRLPDFPDPNKRPWYDETRGLPRLQVEPAPVSGALNVDAFRPGVFIHMAQTEVVKPAALSIFIDGRPLWAAHDPWQQIPDFRSFDLSGTELGAGPHFHRRFYPLRFPNVVGGDPADEHWSPSSLEGLWLGAYSAHGTEVVYVYFDEHAKEVRAMKITGDVNVPRGAVTWTFCLEDRLRPHELPHDDNEARLAFGHDLTRVRLYRGRGTICTTGYVEEQRDYSTDYIGITAPDEIRINWYDMDINFTTWYRRYNGCDSTSES